MVRATPTWRALRPTNATCSMPPKNPWPASRRLTRRPCRRRFAVRPLPLRAANAFRARTPPASPSRARRQVQPPAVTLGDGDAMPSRIVGVVIVGARWRGTSMTAGRSGSHAASAPMARPMPAAKLYVAAGRAARALGLPRLITYTLPAEGRRQLRAARLAPGRTAAAATGTVRAGRGGTRLRRCACQAAVGGAVDEPGARRQCGQPQMPITARAGAARLAPRCRHVPLTPVSSMPRQSRSSRLRRGSDRVDHSVRSGIPARTAIGSPDGDATKLFLQPTQGSTPSRSRVGCVSASLFSEIHHDHFHRKSSSTCTSPASGISIASAK